MSSSEKILVLKHNSKPTTKIFSVGKRIQYQLKNDSTLYHGRIHQIQGDSLIVNNDAVYLKNLKMIHGKPIKLEVARVVGAILLVGGTIVLYAGISALRRHQGAELPFPSVLLSMLGIIMVYLGIGGDFMGLIPFFIRTKTYNIETEWNIRTGNRKKSHFFKKAKADCCD